MSAAAFLWFLHQPVCAAWCKREILARRPDLRFAFSRPGVMTFKVDEARADEPSPSSFSRAWGRSLGRVESVEKVDEIVRLAEGLGGKPLRLHVFERDLDKPADERDPSVVGTRAAALRDALLAAGPTRFLEGELAKRGDLVLDVITAPAELPDDGLLIGWHRHDGSQGPLPGGVPHVAIPANAPSRAWAKIEEAIRWSGLHPKAGDTAIEIGSSPGGASFALLERGLHVHGIDPGDMVDSVLHYVGKGGNRFTHHKLPAAEVERSALPKSYQWLANDVNLAPMIALKYVERLVALAHGKLRGAFITLKINDDGIFEALPRLRTRIGKLGAKRVRYTQLPSHRSEIVAILEW